MWYLPHPPIAYARVKVGYLLSRMKAYLNGSKFRIGISDDLMGIFGPFKWVPIQIAKSLLHMLLPHVTCIKVHLRDLPA